MDKIPVPRPERESYVKHRRDVNRQIILPMVLATVVIVSLAVLAGIAASRGEAGVSIWADIATIWVIVPLMFGMLILLALVGGLAYGLTRLLEVTPRYTGLAQVYVQWFNAQVTIWADKLTGPVLGIKTWLDLLLSLVAKDEKKH